MSDLITTWNTSPYGAPRAFDLQKGIAEPKSAIIDPSNILNYVGTRAKPSLMSFEVLRYMARVPAIAAIINTRLNQVARYSSRPRYPGDVGFKIVLKNPEGKMTEADKKQAFKIEEFFLKTGAVPNRKRKDNFNQFLRKIVRDTLTLDAMVWENVPNFKNGIAEMWAVDAVTIEMVGHDPVGEAATLPVYVPVTRRGAKDKGDIVYVQRVAGQIVAEYTEEELAYGIRNPRTDIDYSMFGFSELETLIETVTGIVNGIRYNTSYFNHSYLPQGVLELIGNYDDEVLESFKRQWQVLTSGATGKWSVPVMALTEGSGFKFTPFKTSNRDMEFNEFLEFLFNIACAVYQIDPNEVGFKSWTSKTNGLSQSDNTAEKIEESHDKGFVPLMNYLADTFNSEVIDHIDDNFAFAWVGVNDKDEEKEWELTTKRLGTGVYVVNDIRKEKDMQEIDEDWANAPANPQLVQVYMAKLNAEQQQEQQEQEADQEGPSDQGDQQTEKIDKEHAHEENMENLTHKHNMEIEKLKASKLKKSLNEDEELEISVSWGDY